MKKLATLFEIIGFVIQYILPVALFGDIIPFVTNDVTVGKCLTGMGYIAVALILFFIFKKVKEWLMQRPKSIKRAIVLSIPSIVWWVAIMLCLDYLTSFVLTFSEFWHNVIIFILLGRGFIVLSESLHAEEGAKK